MAYIPAIATVATRSPGRIPSARSASSRASVPFAVVIGCAAVGRELGLELLHFRSKDVPPRFKHTRHGAFDVFP